MHRTGFNQPGKYSFCHILSDHFHKGICYNNSYSAQIPQKLGKNGGITRIFLDASIRWSKTGKNGCLS